MSQSGKVLHLYVEVRSAPDQNGGNRAFAESEKGIAQGHSVQDSPAELLSQLASQTSCQTVSKVSTAHHLVQDCTHSQSPSRNTVSFQLQQASSSPTVSKRWSAPCDGVSAVHTQPTPSSGKVTVHHTPPNCRRFKEDEVSAGKRSVVTFSYIEKSNVKTIDGRRTSVHEKGTNKEISTPSHVRKRLSDPVWFGSPNSSCSSSPKLTFRSPGSHQQVFSPSYRQTPLDPIGRAATQRAVEEFGSPLLRIKLAHALELTSSSRYNQQPRCQSWAGSPVQRQNISINPKDHITDRSQAPCGLPRSPASDQLSSQSRMSSHSSPHHQSGEDRSVPGSPATKKLIHRACNRSTSPQGAIVQLGNNVVEGLNQLSDSKSSSPAHSPEVAHRLAQEATKVSSVFTETRRSSLHNALSEHASSLNSGEAHNSSPNAQQSKQTLKMNIPLTDQPAPAADDTESHQPENSALHSHSHKTNSYTNNDPDREECFQKSQLHSSVLSAAQSSPALPSRVLRPSHPPTELSSPLRDPRLFQADLRAPATPTLHRRLPPQYTGDSWSPSPDRRGDLSCFEKGDCSEVARRLFINQSVEELPVSWTSREQWGIHVENTLRSSPEPGCRTPDHQSSQRRRPLSPTAQQKRAEQRRREILLLGPVVLDSAEEDEGCDEEEQGDEMEGYGAELQPRLQIVEDPPEAEQNGAMRGSSSRSSSGVTGSLGDRDCGSPETSQSSHHSNETAAATSGIQASTGSTFKNLQSHKLVSLNCITLFNKKKSSEILGMENVILSLCIFQTDSGSAVPVPSLHCQRIARAKWEFLFGTPAEEAASRGEKSESMYCS